MTLELGVFSHIGRRAILNLKQIDILVDLEPCPAFEAAVLKQNQGLLVGGHDYKPQCPRLSNIAASCVMSLTIGSKGLEK